MPVIKPITRLAYKSLSTVKSTDTNASDINSRMQVMQFIKIALRLSEVIKTSNAHRANGRA